MEKGKQIIIVAAGGKAAISPGMLAQIHKEYGKDIIIVEEADLPEALKNKKEYPEPANELLKSIMRDAAKLKPYQPTIIDDKNKGPIGAVLKNKKYR